jgi:FkbM family methyltransferase
MNIKNPKNLIEKSDSTCDFSLSESEKFNDSLVNLEKGLEDIHSILNQYSKIQENNQKINFELLNKIFDEIRFNNELLSNLNSSLSQHDLNTQKYIDLSNNFKNDINKYILNQQDYVALIHDFINEYQFNQELENELMLNLKKSIVFKIDGAVGELDSSLRGYVDGAVGELDSSLRGYVDGAVGELDSSLRGYVDGAVGDMDNLIAEFFNSQNDVNKDLKRAVKLFTSNYKNCKRYFFNDTEKLLKNYMDTDDLFRLCYFNNIQFLSYSPFENKILLQTKEGIIFATNNRFYTIKEVIGFNGYSLPHFYQFDDFVVFDIGMNRGYASLWFAKFENCSAVYGFEIDEDTFDKALYNFRLNPIFESKIFPYKFGLSNNDEAVELYYLLGQDGLSTIISDFTDVQPEFKNNKDKIQVKQVEVKKASEVISNIIKTNNIKSKIVIKIDTEGSEFNIISDLINSGLINEIDVILGEGHIFSNESLSDELLKYGFKIVKFDKHKFTYNFAFVKDRYYDMWHLKEF